MMMRQAALLRGVNLGKRQVIMSELRAACEAAGFTNVKTLLASGNIVLDASEKAQRLEEKLEKVIEDALGLKTDVFVRTGAQLDTIVKANPFKAFAKKDPSHFVVHFLRAALGAADKDALAATVGAEDYAPGKGCLYVVYPDGQARTKLKLPKLGTARNWNTVTKLAAMLRAE